MSKAMRGGLGKMDDCGVVMSGGGENRGNGGGIGE